MELLDNPKGNYRFLSGIDPYSSGVVAMPGHEIVHVTLQTLLPYKQGLAMIDRHLREQGRKRHALCAIELRSPVPYTFEGFDQFNQGYRKLLAEWDLLVEGQNPVARTNVAPQVRPPNEPSLYAFSYTVPYDESRGPVTFVVAGAGELAGGELSTQAIVRAGETSSQAMRAKAAHVMRTMQARLDGLQVAWSDITVVEIYTVHPLQPLLASEILDSMKQAAVHGVHWFLSRPPIIGVEFEMDMRGVRREIRLV